MKPDAPQRQKISWSRNPCMQNFMLNGVEKNPNIAYEWYKKSAAQGNQRARFNMEYLISKKLVK